MLYILNEQTYDLSPTFSENLMEDGQNVVKTTFINSKNEKFFLISKADIAEVFYDENHQSLDTEEAIKRIQE
ncbi:MULTISPECIES: hypothetical protein [Sphingobacterium]|jgi:hypothetical protein|uniref:hypothetical protein n=1 Tax=Sphingobacterium TaxID=28453 RepID=UPI0004E601E6|nr:MULTISPECIES: hypothetical protein [Sphingobacterium]UPZ37995.1 hypothetical protein MUB18_06745 [Sphingobacterium sp. PCS056]UXD69467.1 hypothetical protein MUK51_20105 [Sphingobacterium faecium]WGQ13012.1 hypothetical protein QG727_13345 [Sphingobacterium faecium]CDS93547.1 hypothetical protein BN1088_1431560 [Sphingobacterium sp. PM2-P1-29]